MLKNTTYMKIQFIKDFLYCGFAGWCIECFFTGLCSIIAHKDKRLICTTSLWMFPIYGLAAFIRPLSTLMGNTNFIVRGGVYMFGIFLVEYVTGSILKMVNRCPWDYSNAKFNINGIIRLDYAPCWFLVGLIFEYLLIKNIL